MLPLRPSLSLVLLLWGTLCLSSAAAPKLILRGDDLGSAQAINEAILRCYKQGLQKTTEVMVPCAWFPEAVRLLREHPGLDVGVHLTLTSEWDRVKWRPLTQAASLIDDQGYFFPMVWPNPNYQGRSIREQNWQLADIEKEFRAQIELAKRLIPQLSHLSGHMGCTELDPTVSALTQKLAREYGLDIDLKAKGVVNLGYAGPSNSSDEKIAGLLKALEGLRPDTSYLFVDHPGLDTPEMRALGHVGYEGVALDRQGVTEAWTSPVVKAAIERLGIQILSYSDLRD